MPNIIVDRQYEKDIEEGLDKAYAKFKGNVREGIECDINTARIIIFSDQHRGERDKADDFNDCEQAYNAALGYYLESNYTLIVLGDVEELWECSPDKVIKKYAESLSLEANFHAPKRYIRIYGNHDDFWNNENSVNKHLRQIFKTPLNVLSTARLLFKDGNNNLGEIFLAHGHQGTLDSDKYGKISRFFVRNLWRPFQNLTGIKTTTPARDYNLRDKHNIAMYHWAEKQNKLVLIAGHTHQPVFASKNYLGILNREIDLLREDLKNEIALKGPRVDKLKEDIACKRAEIEFLKSKESGKPKTDSGLSMKKPCYFNTGCCSFSDGDITGIEISNGKVKLVRWPDDQGNPKAKVLDEIELKDVFDKL